MSRCSCYYHPGDYHNPPESVTCTSCEEIGAIAEKRGISFQAAELWWYCRKAGPQKPPRLTIAQRLEERRTPYDPFSEE